MSAPFRTSRIVEFCDTDMAGIVHFAVGNFHRVHQGLAIEACLHHPGHEGWAISGVGLTDGPAARAKAEAYDSQDNLYTVTTLTSPAPRRTQIVGAADAGEV